MRKFFRAHPDILLVVLACTFLIVLIAYYVWGVQYVFQNVNRGLKFAPQVEKLGFDLGAASQLDLRGIKVQ